MRIALVTNEGFPSGMATTNRIFSLMKGLEINGGVQIRIYCVRPTENSDNIINKHYQGTISKNISFIYTNGTVIWPKGKIAKLISLIKGHIYFFFFFIKENKQKKFDILISTTRDYLPNFFYFVYSRLFSLKIVLTIDEYPYVERESYRIPGWFRSIYLRSFYKFFDGLIVMTKVLIDYYKNYTKKGVKFVHIPMTVEPERFGCKKKRDNEKYIAYCGNLGQNQKDGVPILIKAFSQIAARFPDYKLYIIGGTKSSESKEFLKLKQMVQHLELTERVIFTGKINRESIPEFLCNASVLALARPNSLQSQGGFPTKLGEYLATGNPVVVTKVGEIPNYLRDSDNAFLAIPGSVESFSEKLKEAILNKNSFHIAQKGKQLALNEFNYKVQGKKLFEYLQAQINLNDY